MYFEPGKTPHNLSHDPFKSCVVPRPIGWISTVDQDGNTNLAPYSQFQNVTFDPPIVMFSANQKFEGGRKDSVVNVADGGEFVWNMATYALREAVNISSEEFPRGVDEFARAGLTKAPSKLVRPPRVAESPVQFECRHILTNRIQGKGAMGTVDVVFGEVVAIHIKDEALTDGRLDIARLQPLARLGYYDYTYVDKVFTMPPPGGPSSVFSAGLEGSASRVQAAVEERR
jgi:flavin reductase (DIM6/NTAB) family NADH-FMN oxidoreductase RutF